MTPPAPVAVWRRRIANALGHPLLRRLGAVLPGRLRQSAGRLRARLRGLPSGSNWPIRPGRSDAEFLDRPARHPQLLDDLAISNQMLLIWQARGDLQREFDLGTQIGQRRFADWYIESARREYGIEPDLFSHPPIGEDGTAPANPTRPLVGEAGVNLVGHAHGELGLGEDLRMSALALSTAGTPFGIVDFRHGLLSRQDARLMHGSLMDSNRFQVNLIHLNADQLLRAHTTLGRDFFRHRHNIAYPFWELATFPRIWETTLQTVDEIWVASTFVRDAIAASVAVPVHLLPPPLALPAFPRLGREHFGIDPASYTFVFSFDALSYIERKNPLAAVRAFRLAFPAGHERASLIIKSMNARADDPGWRALVAAAGTDKRISLLNATIDRADLLALVNACDCYVSLHRAEGLGRGPLEAMALGKPVIVTGYSGNLDFTRHDTALLVDHSLIPVEPGQYPHHDGQVWAEPDLHQAAGWMRKLVADPQFGVDIGSSAAAFVADTYSPERCARAYQDRLAAIAGAR